MDNQKNMEEILNSLDGCFRATAPDFFYTRLKARMEKQDNPVAARSFWILKPAYAMAAVLAVLILNAFILLQNNKSDNSSLTSDTDTFQSIAAEYRLNDNNNLFDLTEERQP